MLLRSLVLSVLALTLSACNLSGNGSKGPFMAGSNVSLSKLNGQANLIASQTLNTTVNSNNGNYSFSDIEWSGWSQLQVTGQYFNEFTENTSADTITLDAITRKDRTYDSANVHIFSHLAAARIRQRVADGQSRLKAWKRTQVEMKQLFGLKRVSRNIHRGVEQLNLVRGSGRYRKDNANLLLFTGSFLAVGGDVDSLALLTTDFADDGQFNGVGSSLFDSIAAMGATDDLLGTLSSNLNNYGIGNPPNNGDMSTLPIWVNQDVTDNIAPIVTVNGSNPIVIVVGTPYVDEGASATDNVDGEVSAIAVDGSDVIDTSTIGTHTVTYNATDIAGNTGSATRIVEVVDAADTEAPVITLLGDNPETLEVITGEVSFPYDDSGFTVTDNRDESVNVEVEGVVDTSVLGEYILTYLAADLAGNDVTVSRTVNIVDTTNPVISLNGANAIEVVAGIDYEDAGATATDSYYGSVDVVVSGTVDTDTIGTYTLTYTAEDGSNNIATETRTVTVTEAPDTVAPIITLLGDVSVIVEAGTSYSDAGATALDDKDGDLTSAIVVGGLVNVNMPATYTLTYNVHDAAPNAAIEVTRTIIVSDTIAPTITLSGDAALVIQKGTNYIDAGATASDSLEGDITANILVDNPVNTDIPATYTVTYAVSDSASNPAGVVTRSVRVNAPPSAIAGSDVSVLTGNSVDLLGNGSDTDGAGIVTYQWMRGQDILSTLASYSYTPENSETLTFAVTDSDGAVTSDAVNIEVTLPAEYQIVFVADPMTVPRNLDASFFTQGLVLMASVIDGMGNTIVTEPTSDISSVDLSVPASYPLVFSYTDPYGRTITKTLTVVVENHAPLATSDNVTVDEDSTNNLITLIANDSDQGDTLTYTITQPENGSVTGTAPNVAYTPNADFFGTDSFSFTVSDGIAESTGTISITVNDIAELDKTPPVITINGTDVTIGQGLTYNDAGATAIDNVDGIIVPTVTGSVDTDILGDYSIVYTATDAAGNSATKTRTVTVKDITPPVISMNGGDVSLVEGSKYEDAGATAVDNVDGAIVPVVTGSVDVSTSGNYIITYTATDAAGNIATETRNITVTDAIVVSAACTATLASEGVFNDTFITLEKSDTPWPTALAYNLLTVDDIASVFNTARSQSDHNNHNGKVLVMPTQDVWDGYTDSQKALYLINNERCVRGIRPYEGISPTVVTDTAQYYADYLSENNVFGHNEDGLSPWMRLDQFSGVNTKDGGNADFFSRAENLAYTGVISGGVNFPTVHEPVAKAVYAWMYNDKASTQQVDSNTGVISYSYGHREFILARGLVENSGELNKEGLIGVATSTVEEVVNGNSQTKVYTVMNGFDPNENWSMANIQTVDFLESTVCLDGFVTEIGAKGDTVCTSQDLVFQ